MQGIVRGMVSAAETMVPWLGTASAARRVLPGILLVLLSVRPAECDDPAAGKALAEANCSACHALGEIGKSPFGDAPPFRTLRESYTTEELEDAFNDGVAVIHPAMPDWEMTSDQARELTAFIMSIAGP